MVETKRYRRVESEESEIFGKGLYYGFVIVEPTDSGYEQVDILYHCSNDKPYYKRVVTLDKDFKNVHKKEERYYDEEDK